MSVTPSGVVMGSPTMVLESTISRIFAMDASMTAVMEFFFSFISMVVFLSVS